MYLNFEQVLAITKEQEIQDKINHRKNLAAYRRRMNDYCYGANVVGDHDEDYVFDDLFDVPNR